jgi:hypothetical protein
VHNDRQRCLKVSSSCKDPERISRLTTGRLTFSAFRSFGASATAGGARWHAGPRNLRVGVLAEAGRRMPSSTPEPAIMRAFISRSA